MTEQPDTLAVALGLARLGFHVFDVDHPELPKCVGIRTREHDPDSCTERGKHPCSKWSTAATTDPKRVTAMFAGRLRNIGIACGPSGIVVIDEDAMGELERFCAAVGQPVPDTMRVRTGNGFHHYFAAVDGLALGNQEGAFRDYKMNVRGVGGFVVAPGSVHQSGARYQVANGHGVVPLPEFIVAAITGRAAAPASEPFTGPPVPKDHSWWRDAEVIHHPRRHQALIAAAGYCRAVGLTRDGAIPTIRDVWRRCCPGTCCRDERGNPAKTYAWEQALAKLDDVYTRYSAGEAPVQPATPTVGTSVHRLVLTQASRIRTRRVRWLWDARLPLGVLALLAGREGLGKSSIGYWLAARITRGELPGEYHGQPRAVLVSATEDSWAHTVVPRLIAAGADLDRVYRIEVQAADAVTGLILPRDNAEVESAATQTEAALLLLDPVMSRISTALDTYKDPEVRQALEPIAAIADRAGLSVLGVIHLNKTGSVDILDRVIGSKAFAAVARAVCAVVPDPDGSTGRGRLFGVPKNNLGRDDLPSIRFTIQGAPVATDDGGVSDVGRVVLGDEVGTTIREAMERSGEDDDVRTLTAECKVWLTDYLTERSHSDSRDVKRRAADAGYSASTLRWTRKALRVVVTNLSESPRRTVWSLPVSPVVSRARGERIIDTTDINAGQRHSADQGDTTSGANRVSGVTPTREVTRLEPPPITELLNDPAAMAALLGADEAEHDL